MWKKTSRNTSINIVNNKKNKILRLKSDLITKKNYKAIIKSYETLKNISNRTEKFNSPKVIPPYEFPIITMEYIEGETFHQLLNEKKRLTSNLKLMAGALKAFHDVTVCKETNLSYEYIDFGPKNIILSAGEVYLIDPPEEFKLNSIENDVAVLVFETIRSLLQNKKITSIHKAFLYYMDFFNESFSIFHIFKHSNNVKIRYLKIRNKKKNINNFLKLIFYPILLIILDFILGYMYVYFAIRKRSAD